MGSRKPSAKAKQVAAFKSQLGDMDGLFARERKRETKTQATREAALRRKTCESKMRYPSQSEARRAIASCAEHGTEGLHAYRCPYCNGWHLTSRPMAD